jgi:2'-5' RNA ligase
MRLFISVDIPDEVKEEILKIQKEIKDLGRLSLSPKENIHITLKFLGEAEPDKITEILDTINFKDFSVTSDRFGFFPNDNYISVIWLGFKEDNELKDLQKEIDEKLSILFRQEKNFITHATIARVKSIPFENKGKIKLLKERKVPNITFKVSSFKLMNSTLASEGPVYDVLKEFKAKSL